ncbi:MAG: DUF2505 family protein [Actinomycetota bacterium]|nr:DUF2505 family protein [Actinomycetota bacterium]
MRFTAEHQFPAPPSAVVDLLIDPDFMTTVELPDLALPTILVHEVSDTAARLQLRYEYVGQIDALAKRVIGGRDLTWVQDLRLDRTSNTGELTFTAEAAPDKLKARAAVAITPTASGSVRTLNGDFSIGVPLIGGTAERKILPGVLRRLDVEAAAVAAQLAS